MKSTPFLLLLFLSISCVSLSHQEGYYHKQSHFKSSSSSYKNNELQHKKDDEEFSSVHGDLSGRDDPQVNAYSQHTEYRNPNSPDLGVVTPDRYQTVPRDNLGVNTDDVTGSISGQRKHISYSGSYTVSGGQLTRGNYDTQSNLYDLSQKVQNSLSRQLSQAISQDRSYGGARIEDQMHLLEDELRANLTRKLQEELRTQYGSETRRGSYSYSGSQTQPNYNTQELDDLTQQVQTNLIDQLRKEYQTSSSYSSNSYGSYNQKTSGNNNNYRPVYTPRAPQATYPTPRAHQVTYPTPMIRPTQALVDVTTIAQNQLDMILNQVLSNLKTKYLNEDMYRGVYQPDYDVILNDLSAELRMNITKEINNALRNAYGYQEEKNGYFFSTWNLNSNIANYRQEDLDNLKKQVEKNLFDKLNQEVTNLKSSYTEKRTHYLQQTRHQQNYNTQQYDSQGTYYRPIQIPYPTYPSQSQHRQTEELEYHNENRYQPNTYTQRPYKPAYTNTNYGSHQTDNQQVEEIDYQYKPQTQKPIYISATYPSTSNGYSSSRSSQSESSYSYASGSQHQPQQPQGQPQLPVAELTRIRDELNRDLSQQVQRVVQQQRDQNQLYSASQTSQTVTDDLSEELKRNFSRRVEEVLREHGHTGGYSFTMSGGYTRDGFAKLQEELLRQLREGLASNSFSVQTQQPIRYTSSYGGGSSYSGSGSSSSYSSGSYSGGYGMRSSGYAGTKGGYGSSGYRDMEFQRGGECCMQSDEAPSPKTITPPRADIEVDAFEMSSTEKTRARDRVTERSKMNKLDKLNQEISQQIEGFDRQRGLTQETGNFRPQSVDLTQQTVAFRPQSGDLTQQTIEFEPQSSDLSQQTIQFKPQSADLTQQTVQFHPQTADLTQQTVEFHPQTADLTQQTVEFHPQNADLTQQTVEFHPQNADLTQQTVEFHPQNADLTQQTVEFHPQNAIPKQEIAQVQEVPSFDAKSSTVSDDVETTTESKGFWKKLGGKITTGFNNVKDKFQSIG